MCAACLKRLLVEQGYLMPTVLRQRLHEAYTTALGRFSGPLHPQSAPSAESIPNQVEVKR
jgi:hypothetical protein